MERDDKVEALLQGSDDGKGKRRRALWFIFLAFSATSIAYFALRGHHNSKLNTLHFTKNDDVIESHEAVVAADDGRCSEIGVSALEKGGHAVDAAVATALCLGVVSPSSSGIGGGAFMVVRSSSSPGALAIDMRETAPAAASENMYEGNAEAKTWGALAMGIPGEIAGLHVAWLKHGRLPWKALFEPAIKLARDGFVVSLFLGEKISGQADNILADPGLQQVFAPNGKLLKTGDICYNVKLGNTLQAIAEQGPEAFYNGSVGERLVEDVKKAGGILTMEDLRNYRAEVTAAVEVDAMGYKIFGMPPPSSGTVGLALILNIFESYGNRDATKGLLGLHRLVEALKHMFAIRMNLGDPNFVDITKTVEDMLSPSFAKRIRERIFDNTTFPPEYYLPRWSQLRDQGTSHFCIVDTERNAVSMTTTVNYGFGGKVLSPSTGIVLNNEMDDFSIPTDVTPDELPPAPANFIRPGKRPLSSMTPLIVLKDNHLAGVFGGSGGLSIIPAVTQVFLNHFILGMEPLAAVESPRIYHKLIPNVVLYENWTVIDGEHIELSDEKKQFLIERGHQLQAQANGAICQLVVQNITKSSDMGRKTKNREVYYDGILTAVSDPRKGGWPAAADNILHI